MLRRLMMRARICVCEQVTHTIQLEQFTTIVSLLLLSEKYHVVVFGTYKARILQNLALQLCHIGTSAKRT